MSRGVVITGTSRGVGRALAQMLVERGWTVFGCSRTSCDLVHDRYRHFSLDITDEQAVRVMFEAVRSASPRLDLVINNAGITQARMALFTSVAEVNQIVGVNLIGAFIVTREAIKLMKRSRFGRIINMSSINVPLAASGSALYNATKAALENLATTLSRECAGDDITINCLGLSLVANSGMAEGLSEAALATKQRALSKPGLLDILEIVHAIDFLAAPEAKNITGQTIYFGGIR